MTVDKYIQRSENGEPGYDPYLGISESKHWFLDPVMGVESG